MIGSPIFVSIAVVNVRKRAFEDKLKELADHRQNRLRISSRLVSTLSKTKRRLSRTRSRGAEVAAGVVRGRVIIDPPPDQPYIPSLLVRESTRSKEELETGLGASLTVPQSSVPRLSNRSIQFAEQSHQPALDRTNNIYHRRHLFSNSGVGVHSFATHPRNSGPQLEDEEAVLESPTDTLDEKAQIKVYSKLTKYVDTINGYLGRNSQFFSLTEKERRQLGGIEYDALCILSYVVALYYVLFQLLGAIGCGAWMLVNQPETARRDGQNPFWTGAFFGVAAFNNSGMALLNANATVFQTDYYMLLSLSLLTLAGNTCFPPFLRLIIWLMKTLTSRWERWRDTRKTLQFILDHPRRVYTNLFPAAATWWLVLSLVVLNGVDWFAFEVFNIGNPTIDSIAPRYRAIDGLFQAFAVRASGFTVVNIYELYPGTLVLYVVMMYLSAYPVTMTIRNTNVYEERSLAIFAEDPAPFDVEAPINTSSRIENKRRSLSIRDGFNGMERTSRVSQTSTERSSRAGWSRLDFIRQQLHSQLGHDLWWLALTIVLITIIETGQHLDDPVNFSVFNIIFEVVSAYATVGISIGVPWADYSFSGTWHTLSKLILCAVMVRGRHRGLPVAIDRAVLLPDRTLWWAEEEDGRMRKGRASSFGAVSRTSAPHRLEQDLRLPNATGSDVG